ncbi:hypothetical protein QFC21_004233 [Naganishia friedmannii]|uniref:Uncharacterized protein n=1 Tax=Naganishia friedmannii TaxID=89922 RepID=A0ACC2VJ11_9TREE|nr:hypothetical protein QFC21_004233 [Naganishia friedmannii]
MSIFDYFSSASPAKALVPEKTASTTQNSAVKTPNTNVNPLNPEGLKPCCACPATKSLRDDCFLKTNPDTAQEDCREFIEKHKECMRGYGFKV